MHLLLGLGITFLGICLIVTPPTIQRFMAWGYLLHHWLYSWPLTNMRVREPTLCAVKNSHITLQLAFCILGLHPQIPPMWISWYCSSIPGLGRSPGEGIYYPLQYSWASLVAQMVKESACNAGDLGSIPGLGRFPWRRAWLPTPVLLLGCRYVMQRPQTQSRYRQGCSCWGGRGSKPAHSLSPLLLSDLRFWTQLAKPGIWWSFCDLKTTKFYRSLQPIYVLSKCCKLLSMNYLNCL